MRLNHWLASLMSCAILIPAAACQSATTVISLSTQEGAPTLAVRTPPDSPAPTISPALATELPAPETAPIVSSPALPAVSSTATSIAPTPCAADLCAYSDVLFLQRPITPPGNDEVEATYRFGSTQGGLRDPHHGVEFLNRFGAPVLAAASGKVVVAGVDLEPTSPRGVWPITFYGPYSNFYGNLVVIEHTASDALLASIPDLPLPIFSLYGHLSEMHVHLGQEVQAGQEIGKVGMTGIATGSHLHFEVRLGENSYKASRNPELWLSPRLDSNGQPMGALAGHFLNSFNSDMEMPSIVLQHLPNGSKGASDFEVSLSTYEEKGLLGQPPFQDSFGIGDLPAGWYRITFPMGGLRQELAQVFPGQLTVLTFRWK